MIRPLKEQDYQMYNPMYSLLYDSLRDINVALLITHGQDTEEGFGVGTSQQ